MEKETDPKLGTREIMEAFGKAITEILPGKGYFLLIFEFNSSNDRANYISNGERADVIKSMKEFIERTENAWAVDKYEGEFGQGRKDG
jgi:hypothetical protein